MPHIFVEDYGAVGDGTTIDSAAIQAALDAAGVGGSIAFTPGKTYLFDTLLRPLANQKIDYNGATVKRAPQAKTTLTAAFSDAGAGNVVLAVDDASDFRVGSAVTVCLAAVNAGWAIGDGNDNPYQADTQTHLIISKTATTLTVQGGFFGAGIAITEYPIGAEVVSAYHCWFIDAAAPGVEIFGGIHDGATTAHDSAASGSTAGGWQVRGRRWETTVEILCSGDGGHFHDIEFSNLPAEGIFPGGRGTVVERCKGTNVGGNFTHASGGDDVRIDKCHVEGANRVWIEHDGLGAADAFNYGTVGHENGAYAWSLECQRVHLTNCYAEDALCLFSPLYATTSDKATISLCTGRGLVVGFHLVTFDSQGADVILDRVRLYDCGLCSVGRTTTNATFAQSQVRTTMIDCELVNTKLNIQYAHQFKMIGGRIRHDTPSGAGGPVVTITGGSDIEIRTEIDGAAKGIYASGVVDGLTIACKWRRIHAYGISLVGLDAACRRIHVVGNDVLIADYRDTDADAADTEPSATVSFCVMDLGVAENNRVRMTKGRAAFELLDGTAIVRRNHIETNTATTTRPVLIWSGTGSAVYDNTITVALRDDPGRGVSAGAAISQAGGTPGNGTVDSLTVDALALVGTYWIFINSPSTNAGRYMVFRPDGVLDGAGAVPGAYNGMINFTLSDGSTDFTIGDRIPITVTGNVIENNRTIAWGA